MGTGKGRGRYGNDIEVGLFSGHCRRGHCFAYSLRSAPPSTIVVSINVVRNGYRTQSLVVGRFMSSDAAAAKRLIDGLLRFMSIVPVDGEHGRVARGKGVEGGG